MRTHLVVVFVLAFDQDSGFAARAEPLDEQALVAELAVEALVSAVLSGLFMLVEYGGDARMRDPIQDGVADEL